MDLQEVLLGAPISISLGACVPREPRHDSPLLLLVTMPSPRAAAAEPWGLDRCRAILDQTAELRLRGRPRRVEAGRARRSRSCSRPGSGLQSLYKQQRQPPAGAAGRAALEGGRQRSAGGERPDPSRCATSTASPPVQLRSPSTTTTSRSWRFAPGAGATRLPPAATIEGLEAAGRGPPRAPRRAARLPHRRSPRGVPRRSRRTSPRCGAPPGARRIPPGPAGAARGDAEGRLFYAVPQAVAHADEHGADPRPAARGRGCRRGGRCPVRLAYLRHRGRDLLANDYEAGDASWVNGHFRALNAQIGSYETYDDALLGVKAFFSLLAAEEGRGALGRGRAGGRRRPAADPGRVAGTPAPGARARSRSASTT